MARLLVSLVHSGQPKHYFSKSAEIALAYFAHLCSVYTLWFARVHACVLHGVLHGFLEQSKTE